MMEILGDRVYRTYKLLDFNDIKTIQELLAEQNNAYLAMFPTMGFQTCEIDSPGTRKVSCQILCHGLKPWYTIYGCVFKTTQVSDDMLKIFVEI